MHEASTRTGRVRVFFSVSSTLRSFNYGGRRLPATPHLGCWLTSTSHAYAVCSWLPTVLPPGARKLPARRGTKLALLCGIVGYPLFTCAPRNPRCALVERAPSSYSCKQIVQSEIGAYKHRHASSVSVAHAMNMQGMNAHDHAASCTWLCV